MYIELNNKTNKENKMKKEIEKKIRRAIENAPEGKKVAIKLNTNEISYVSYEEATSLHRHYEISNCFIK